MSDPYAVRERVSAIIFDFDGVLVESDEVHWRAYQKAFGEYGIRFSLDEYRKSAKGRSRSDVVAHHGSHLDGRDRERISKIKGEAVRQFWASNALRPVPGAVDFVRSARARGLRCAVASTSEIALFAIERLGIAGLFEFVAAKRSTDRPKPHPDVFLRALRHLGLQASDCLVVEDTPTGAEAARRAGMRVVLRCTDGVPAAPATADGTTGSFVTFAELHARLGWGAMGDPR